MAGLLHGSVDHLVGNTGSITNNHQEYFVALNNFLAARYTRIASNFGSGGVGLDGAGFDFWDAGSGQAAREAWAVYRLGGNALPLYNLVVSWSDIARVSWFQNGSSTTDGTGIGAAVLDTGADAWNGGVADIGADAVGTPRWVIGAASNIFTLDWFNEPGGARVANRDNLIPVSGIMNASTDRSLFHMWADDDGFFVVYDDDVNGNIVASYRGSYELVPGATQLDGMPAVGLFAENSRWPTPGGAGGFVFGTTTQEGGGLLPPQGGGGLPSFHLENFLGSTSFTAYQPNRQLDLGGFHAPKHALINRQGAQLGHVGYLPGWARYAIGLPINGRNAGNGGTVPHRAFFGTATTDIRGVMPWHPGGPPGANASRAGTQFTWTGTGTPT